MDPDMSSASGGHLWYSTLVCAAWQNLTASTVLAKVSMHRPCTITDTPSRSIQPLFPSFDSNKCLLLGRSSFRFEQTCKDLKEENEVLVSLAPVTKHVCSVAGGLCCAALHVACDMVSPAFQRLTLADGCRGCLCTTAQTFCNHMHTTAHKSLGAYSVLQEYRNFPPWTAEHTISDYKEHELWEALSMTMRNTVSFVLSRTRVTIPHQC